MLVQTPAPFGKLLHICRLIPLIDDLKTEDGFNNIFHGEDTAQAAVFIDQAFYLPDGFREGLDTSNLDLGCYFGVPAFRQPK